MTGQRWSEVGSPDVEVSFDPTDERPSDVLVRAVAVASDEDPMRLPPLLTAVDPDALDKCARPPRSSMTVRFPYAGYRVVLSTDGYVGLFGE
ncbi:HalOD1 output domain-containing protein [Halomarina rubra]|uniref:HalOD1 output domain-containing protein n=1 Tax=Halomarina rubra TaxID=2071873 RepID=A0ABD6B0Z1_9EURY|nr:HalOD1 output domain-containing protein [Halomarina rubra]